MAGIPIRRRFPSKKADVRVLWLGCVGLLGSLRSRGFRRRVHNPLMDADADLCTDDNRVAEVDKPFNVGCGLHVWL